ncbi:hypothetical protein AV530_016591 [Patagioenas fasciata monilis]|uniref:Uncharacterized protein n=1 Tax=Patagioenas fasciata monilis TaxID=372326 RepID=A0A1V4J2T3_PATFA|nr:hypothetical protein AV530_016591 [Patagioenas fasciata monilis]
MLVIITSGVSIANATERTEGDQEQNKALRVDSELEKMWVVVLISWIIVHVRDIYLTMGPRAGGIPSSGEEEGGGGGLSVGHTMGLDALLWGLRVPEDCSTPALSLFISHAPVMGGLLSRLTTGTRMILG